MGVPVTRIGEGPGLLATPAHVSFNLVVVRGRLKVGAVVTPPEDRQGDSGGSSQARRRVAVRSPRRTGGSCCSASSCSSRWRCCSGTPTTRASSWARATWWAAGRTRTWARTSARCSTTSAFARLTTVGYPPPWPLALGLLYRVVHAGHVEPPRLQPRHQAPGDRRQRRPRLSGRRRPRRTWAPTRRRRAGPGSSCCSTRSCCTSAPPGGRSTRSSRSAPWGRSSFSRGSAGTARPACWPCPSPSSRRPCPSCRSPSCTSPAGLSGRPCATPRCSQEACSSSAVLPFAVFAWDPATVVRHLNAHFVMTGTMSLMTVVRLFRDPLLMQGHWWLLGLLWIPALAVATAVALRRGVDGFDDLVRGQHRAGAGVLPHAHLARRAQRDPPPPPRADPDVAGRARPARPHGGLGHPSAVHGVQRLAAAAALRRVSRRHAGVARCRRPVRIRHAGRARRPGDRLADRGVVDRRLVLQKGSAGDTTKEPCGGAEHPAVRRSLAERSPTSRATRASYPTTAPAEGPPAARRARGAGRGGRRASGSPSSSAGSRRSSRARWSWPGGERARSGK